MKTQVYTFYSSSPNQRDLEKVALALKKGAIVIFPTDTVYAIGCLSNHTDALKRFAKLRTIKIEKAPLSFLFEDFSALSNFVKPISNQVFRLLKRTLPGPYAYIMEAAHKLPMPFQKRKNIGVRISSHPILMALLPLLEAPLLTSSLHAKDAIMQYPSDPDEILDEWEGKVDVMLLAEMGGKEPSTVIDLTAAPFEVLREGKGDISIL